MEENQEKMILIEALGRKATQKEVGIKSCLIMSDTAEVQS